MPPFTVLHVCMGNICRSPMAERLLASALHQRTDQRIGQRVEEQAGQRIGQRFEELFLSHSAGTGSWHAGEPMNSPAARQLAARGASATGFRARRVTTDMIDTADLVLCATADQVDYVLSARPDAIGKTFVLGEFGRLLGGVELDALPPVGQTSKEAYERGVALVAAADAERAGGWDADDHRKPSRPADDLDDPWGMGDREFARVADEIECTVVPLAAALTG